MYRISHGSVLLDAWEIAAQGYRGGDYVPLASMDAPQAPYQAASQPPSTGDGQPPSGDEEPPAAGQGAAPVQEQRRKRKRKSRRPPNAAELEAQERAEAAVPLLQAAAGALQQWMAARQCTSLLQLWQDSHQPAGVQHFPAPTNDMAAGQSDSGGVAPPPAAEGPERADADANTAAVPPNYVALAALRHALRPKFEWAAPNAAGHGDAERPLPGKGHRCNLFGQLVRNEGPGEALGLAAGHAVLVPGRTAFLMSDIKQLAPLVQAAESEGGFDCIVLDPPWENKSAARGAKYPTLPSRNLLALPLPALVHPSRGSGGGSGGESCGGQPEGGSCGSASEVGPQGVSGAAAAGPPAGCLVALWVTNRERHRRFVEQELLPAWGLRQVATWYWLKITTGGEPVGRLDIAHRRPFEPILLCRPVAAGPTGAGLDALSAGLPPQPGAPAHQANAPEVPDGLVIMSVPTQHSRKPHLGPLLRPFLPQQSRCLEMFARELFPGWTSWGNEVLKFQGLEHFQRRAAPC